MPTKPNTSQITYDTGSNKQDLNTILDTVVPIADYTSLRAYTGRATHVRITADGIAGVFKYDSTDTTSVDNGGTIIVAGTKRWKRVFDGVVNIKWFGITGDGSDETSKFILACSAGTSITITSGMTVHIKDAIITSDIHIHLEEGSVLKCVANASYYIAYFSGALTISGYGTIDGNKQNQVNRPFAISVAGTYLNVSNISFVNCVKGAISIYNPECDVFIDKITSKNLAIHGGTTGLDTIHIYITDAKNVKITNSVFSHPTNSDPEKNPGGIHITGTTGTSCVISGNSFTNIGQSAANNLTGAIDLYTYADNTVISNNICISNTYAVAFKLQNTKNLICEGNIISGYVGVTPTPATGFLSVNKARTYANEVSTIVVSNNVVEDLNSATTTGQCITISGRLNGDNTVDAIDKIVVSGNIVKGRNSGILVQYVNDCLITGNHVTSSLKGIEIGRHNTLSPIINISSNTTQNCNFGIIHANGDLANATVICNGNLVSGNANTTIHINFASSISKMISRLAITNNVISGTTLGYNIQAAYVTNLIVTNNMSQSTSHTVMYRDTVTNLVQHSNSWDTQATSVIVGYGTTIPTNGTWTAGSIVYNSAPVAGGIPGWVCVSAGSPGTWKAMATLAA